MTQREFLSWEKASRDTIDVKRVYCDLGGGLIAGVLLSQIVFWNLPGKKGQEHRLRVQKNGFHWLAKNHSDWWDECRVSAKQAALALNRMQRKGLLVVVNSMFSGKKTPFIRLNWDGFLRRLDSCIEKQDAETLDFDQTSQSVSTKRRNRFYPKVEIGFNQTSQPITETTSEITT